MPIRNKPSSSSMSNSRSFNLSSPKSLADNLQFNLQKQKQLIVIRVVLLCKNCKMVYIGDKKRVLCPYCGSFFDSKIEENLNLSNKRFISGSLSNVLKPKESSRSASDQDSDGSESDDDSGSSNSSSNNDVNRQRNESNGSRIKRFFKNLIGVGGKKSNTKQQHQKTTKDHRFKSAVAETNLDNAAAAVDAKRSTLPKPDANGIIEVTDLKHPFLSVKNNDPNFCKEFKENNPMIKSVDQFRSSLKQAIETESFDKLKEFYCWTFSRTRNLCDLLVTRKTVDSKNKEPNFGISTNWRLMKDMYNCLNKYSDLVEITLLSINFCVANDLKPMAEKLRSIIMAERIEQQKMKENAKKDDTLKEVRFVEPNEQRLITQTTTSEIKSDLIVQIVNTYIILLCNPLFDRIENFTLFSVMLNELAILNSSTQNSLIFSLRKEILGRMQYFLEIGFFPLKRQKTPPLIANWLSSSVRAMAILHCTNELQIQYYKQHHMEYAEDALKANQKQLQEREQLEKPNDDEPLSSISSTILKSSSSSSSLFISYQEFYMKQLDNLDLYKEYLIWQKINKTDSEFSLCQYPFILSLSAKRKILERDSEQQMILIAKKSFLDHARNRRDMTNDSVDLFLTIRVSRENLVSDSMNQIELKKTELKKKLRVNFIGEAAIDMGGVRKEWFLLLVRKLFSPVYGMFTYIKESNFYWFTMSPAISLAEYNLIGVVMGLAVYNGEILDIRFPPCVYKKLLSPEIVPFEDKANAQVGVVKSFTLLDLKFLMPSLAASLQNLLDYEGNVKEDFMMNFQVSFNSEFDQIENVLLKENGDKIELSNENRKEFVDLYVDFLLNKSIYEKFKAFYYGFHSVCASNALILLRPEEIESLVCGSTESFKIDELKTITLYDGYKETDEVITWFWEILNEFEVSQQKRLLLFATGSDRIPIGGIREMSFKIIRVESKNQLPSSHTCFNQLVLPHYNSKEVLKSKLLISIENAEGFGFK